MGQPIRKNIKTIIPKKRKHIERTKASKIRYARERAKGKQEYGTSKLEERFARDFLDKLGVNYTYQYKAESIGRYFDFYLNDYRVLIEVDGDYYHSYNLLYEQMSPMQKHNKRVDEEKNRWASLNRIPLLRIWEHEINEQPKKVMDFLKEKLKIFDKNKKISDGKKKRH
jgi:very-short-patch-repair endonuclease